METFLTFFWKFAMFFKPESEKSLSTDPFKEGLLQLYLRSKNIFEIWTVFRSYLIQEAADRSENLINRFSMKFYAFLGVQNIFWDHLDRNQIFDSHNVWGNMRISFPCPYYLTWTNICVLIRIQDIWSHRNFIQPYFQLTPVDVSRLRTTKRFESCHSPIWISV